MPYFKKNNINLLYIHIPKTGGSSIEKYFSKKYRIKLDQKALYGFLHDKHNRQINPSLQHLTYNNIVEYHNELNINMNHLDILTVVRDPYDRCISDLFYFKKIDKSASPEKVFQAIQDFVKQNPDNHATPQYKFVTDGKGELIHNMKIMNTETLNDDMIRLGYTDFDFQRNVNPDALNYKDYLNADSIQFINDYYDKDFTLFHYNKKSTTDVYESFENFTPNQMNFNDPILLILLCAFTLIVIDGVFLYWMRSVFGKQVLSVQHSALQMDLVAAALCYAVIVAGLYYFIIRLNRSLSEAFFLGIVVYATFELTNKALLKNWNWSTVAMDTLWGGTLFASTTGIVRAASGTRIRWN